VHNRRAIVARARRTDGRRHRRRGTALGPGRGSFVGAENVSRLLAATIGPFRKIGGVVTPHEANGQPGAVFYDQTGCVLNTWTLEILDGQIQTIRTVINPSKLAHVGPVADAWAVMREATQARRSAYEPDDQSGPAGPTAAHDRETPMRDT
jgi:hypothetical protein